MLKKLEHKMNGTCALILSKILPVKSWRKKFRKQILNKNASKLKSLGTGGDIRRSAKLENPRNISIGNNTYIGSDNRLYAMGEIKIGNNCALGEGIIIYTSNHDYKDLNTFPFNPDALIQKVEIEDDVWVGARAIILPGCKIGAGSVIGAGAVVTKSVPRCSIVGGNPAKIIGRRDEENYNKRAKDNNFDLSKREGKLIYLDGFKPEMK